MRPSSLAAILVGLLLRTSCLAAGPAQEAPWLTDAPFGLAQGTRSVALLEMGLDRTKSLDGFELIGTPPDPIDDVSFYLVSHSAPTGLCAAMVVTPFPGATALSDARAEVDRRRRVLRATLGLEDLVKTVRAEARDSFGSEPTFEGLRTRAQHYSLHWERPTSPLPDALSAVRMQITSLGDVAYVHLQYDFANRDDCLIAKVSEGIPRAIGPAPLGVRPGAELEEIMQFAVPDFAPEEGFTSQVPIARSPSPEFPFATVIFSKTSGACGMIAKSSPLDEAGDGRFSRRLFDKHRRAYDAAFGESRFINGPTPGSPFKTAQFWMEAMVAGEWVQAASWSKSDGARLPQGLRALGLWIRAESERVPVVTMLYEFDNIDDCLEQYEQDIDDAL